MRKVPVSAADYPAAIPARDPAAPPVLFVQGRLPDPSQRQVAIVGTRGALIRNLERARQLAADLVHAGLGIVSGGALGIDAAAHEGALEAGGDTVAVLGSGLDIRYPERNSGLFQRIERQGALVSAFPLGTPPRRPNFPQRNRIIAAWADVVVVMEAPARSGALNTARWARQLGVPVLALAEGVGARGLLGRGHAGQLDHAGDVLAVLAGAPPRTSTAPGDPDQQEALEVLRTGSLSVDGLATRLGWTVSRAAGALIRLELAGLARLEAGGRYRWNASP
jgi:DNA processing protein